MNESEIAMSLTPSPFLLTSLKTLARSLLFALGIDLIVIDFLTRAAIGAIAVLLAILFVGIRVPRRGRPQSFAHAANSLTKAPALPNRIRVKA